MRVSCFVGISHIVADEELEELDLPSTNRDWTITRNYAGNISMFYLFFSGYLQDGAPKIAKLPYTWLSGRYNYS